MAAEPWRVDHEPFPINPAVPTDLLRGFVLGCRRR